MMQTAATRPSSSSRTYGRCGSPQTSPGCTSRHRTPGSCLSSTWLYPSTETSSSARRTKSPSSPTCRGLPCCSRAESLLGSTRLASASPSRITDPVTTMATFESLASRRTTSAPSRPSSSPCTTGASTRGDATLSPRSCLRLWPTAGTCRSPSARPFTRWLATLSTASSETSLTHSRWCAPPSASAPHWASASTSSSPACTGWTAGLASRPSACAIRYPTWETRTSTATGPSASSSSSPSSRPGP
mmetsp:Transcript_12236/g.28619  ORF Transcript_12236/g.28619 Transcript_12236/m.28619 type:complete len:245 (-) Transcript_12236:1689-2423(-)